MSEARELAGHVLGRRVAVGGMAEIYEARPIGGGELVVLKILLPQYASDPAVVQMLEHEGRLMQRVAGPGLVRVIDVHAEGPEPCLVLEHVDGVAASDVIARLRARGERADAAMALALVLPLLDALAGVHGARDEDGGTLGIVHRDVTPHNVLVRRDGAVLLGDFGIARSSLRDARTRTGVIRGKLRYLAPEQATGSSVDARTDLYGVGLVLWELLAGAPYLDAESEVELLRLAERPAFRRPSELAPVDPRFDRVLERLLARFPEERPASAAAARRLLEPIAHAVDLEAGRRAWAAHAGAMVPQRPASTMKAQPGRKTRWRWLAVAAVAVLGVIGARMLASDQTDVRTGDRTADQASDPAPRPSAVERRAATPVPARPPAVVGLDPPPAEAEGPTVLAPSNPRRHALRSHPPRVPEPATAPAVAPDLEPARARLRALRASLAQRGVLDADLSPSQRGRVREIDRAIAASDAYAAARALDAAEPELSAIAIDERFVRRKLERVDSRIRAARASGTDTSAIERTSALALQDLLEGRHDATNRRLNQILAALAAE